MATYRRLMGEPTGWLPREIGQIPLPQLLAIFHEDQQASMSAEEQLAALNRMRARKGLPPVESRRKRKQ